MHDTTPVLNEAILMELAAMVGDDPDALQDFIAASLPDLSAQIDAIATAARKDAASLKKAAHTLKGGGGALGAQQLRMLASNLETKARDGFFGEDVEDDVIALRTAYDRFVQALDERRKP